MNFSVWKTSIDGAGISIKMGETAGTWFGGEIERKTAELLFAIGYKVLVLVTFLWF
jgi:hypothetical protein